MKRVLAAAVVLAACGGEKQPPPLPPACDVPVHGTAITFRLVPGTKGSYLLVTSPPNDLRRFTVDQGGRVRQFDDSGFTTTLLTLDDPDFVAGGEQGLLGLAFHPKFATNGQFFIYYTTADANVVARYQISATDPNAADPASRVEILRIADFATNHNGGMMEFGPDGMLYIGTGDGGGGGDPHLNGQNPNALLGKLLRIDVDKVENGKPYGIPAGNPFASGGGAPEVYVMGLRNPWRWSFDRKTGDLYIGDVGQDQVEELDVLPAGKIAGLNLGWNMYEGGNCFTQPCDQTGKVMPVFTKTHAENWCSVIGGAVYRAACYPDLDGTYFFSDYCAHELVAAKQTSSGITFEMPTVSYIDGSGTHDGMPAAPASLHADARGELYLTADPGILRLEITQ